MRSPLRHLPHQAAHQALAVMLAALGTMMAENAASQTPQNVQPYTQGQKPVTPATNQPNQPKRPVTTANTQVARPPTTPPPKPSLFQRLVGGGSKNTSPNSNSLPQQQQPQQQHWFQKLPFLNRHSDNSPGPSHPTTPNGGPSVFKPQVGTARPGTQADTPGIRENRTGAPSPQRLAVVDPSRPMQSPGMSSLVPQPRPFPYRPGVPSGGETHMPNGNLVRTAPDGSITDLHNSQHNMSVHYGLSGSRQVRVEQPDGSRVVLASRGVPYMQKPWNFGASAFDHRTYLDNGRLTHQFYRPYSYGGTTLDVYAPQRFYSQDFYQWAAKPQPWAPPSWTFVTRQEPWYAHYQTYFTPQASYASPVLWLTDFVLAMSLFEAYNAHPLPTRAPPAAPATPAAPTSQPITQASTATAPIVQPPIAQAPTPAAAAIPGGPDQAPVLRAPVTAAPTAQVLGAAPPATQVALTSQPPSPTRAYDDGPSMWQRFTNYIRTLLGWGETPHETLQAAPAAAPVAAEPVVAQTAAPITGDVKALVADEVARQIEEEAREARGNAQSEEPKPGAGGVVEELKRPTQHVFVVASDLDLVDDSGRRCMMSEADVVQIVSAVNPKTDTAQGIVLSSKGGAECAQSATVDVAVSDLQEMQNHMRATIDQGLANTPRGATEPTVTAAFAAAAPPPDAEAKTAIEQQKAVAATIDKG